MSDQKTIGITLSGGGARGIAHIGVLQALEEIEMEPDVIIGVSSGSIVGGGYGVGYSPKELLKLLRDINFRKLFQPRFLNYGIFKTKRINRAFREHLGDVRFEDLRKELFVTAVNLNQGEVHHFNKGNIIRPILASCSLPVLFPPVRIGKSQYVDGGVLNNLPVRPLEDQCDIKLAVNVNPLTYRKHLNSYWSIAERTVQLIVRSNIKSNIPAFDYVIEPLSLAKVSAYDVSDMESLYRIGYDWVKQHRQELLELK